MAMVAACGRVFHICTYEYGLEVVVQNVCIFGAYNN